MTWKTISQDIPPQDTLLLLVMKEYNEDNEEVTPKVYMGYRNPKHLPWTENEYEITSFREDSVISNSRDILFWMEVPEFSVKEVE